MAADDEWQQIIGRQLGLITTQQLATVGKSKRAVQHLVARGALERELPGVLRVPTYPRDWKSSLMAACLWAGTGSAASHRSAAALLGLPGGNRNIVELTTDRNLSRCGVTMHRAPIHDEEIETPDGIPATNALRTLVDLGTVCSDQIVADAVDEALRKRMVTAAELRSHARSLSPSAWGSRAFRAAVEDVDVRLQLTESVFEGRLFRVLTRAGLPPPIPQYVVRHEGRPVARVDFAYPEARLAIEAESIKWHGNVTRSRHEYNLERQNLLSRVHWDLVLVGWGKLKERPKELVDQISEYLFPSLEL